MPLQARTSGRPAGNTIVTVVVCIALGAVAAAMASLNVAIPGLVRSTHASQTQLEWIIDAYLLVFAVLLPPAGAAGAAILAAISVATLLSSHPLPAPPQTVKPRPVRTS